ncbi:hypothetical protein QUF72_15610 [Desulfobacterales bacterium HSG2]|nr:hypothetical protein [Desulfobacterales bacterium HSG2]
MNLKNSGNRDISGICFNLKQPSAYTLKDLAVKGGFGKAALGMPQNSVRTILGDPDLAGSVSQRYKKPNIWRYGDLELGFSRPDYTLSYFAVNYYWCNYSTPKSGKKLKFDPWILVGKLQPDEFVAAMKRERVENLEVEKPWNEDCREFVTELGMHIIFQMQGEDREHIGLHKFVVSRHTFPKADGCHKQVWMK